MLKQRAALFVSGQLQKFIKLKAHGHERRAEQP
jgi:hypothetical protein